MAPFTLCSVATSRSLVGLTCSVPGGQLRTGHCVSISCAEWLLIPWSLQATSALWAPGLTCKGRCKPGSGTRVNNPGVTSTPVLCPLAPSLYWSDPAQGWLDSLRWVRGSVSWRLIVAASSQWQRVCGQVTGAEGELKLGFSRTPADEA